MLFYTFSVQMELNTDGIIIIVDISLDVWHFWNHEIKKDEISLDVRQKCDRAWLPAEAGDKIPKQLYSLIKPTRTLMTASLSGK